MQILFRTDATSGIGFGHLARCTTLARTLQACGEVDIVFAHADTHPPPPTLVADGIRTIRFPTTLLDGAFPIGWERQPAPVAAQLRDAKSLRNALADFSPDWIVVDHYLLDETWEAAWPDARILVIDDLANRPHACDLLLDQNLGSSAADYRSLLPARAQVIAGPYFAMLRPEFSRLRPAALKRRCATDEISRVLVNFGGSDIGGLTAPVLEQLLALKGSLAITVLCGSTTPELRRIRELSKDSRVNLHVDSSGVAQLLLQADLAIGAAGATSWERACLGLPTIMIPVADNQRPIARRLVEVGAAAAVHGPTELVRAFDQLRSEMTAWHEMVASAASLTDGRGSARVSKAIIGIGGSDLELQLAGPGDCEDVWAWRNDPLMRAMAHVGTPVTLRDHRKWFDRMLTGSDHLLYVARSHGARLGMVRFDFEGDHALVSINIAPPYRGKSLGYDLLVAGLDAALRDRSVPRFIAEVRHGNVASARLFSKAGFRQNGRNFEFATYVFDPTKDPAAGAQR